MNESQAMTFSSIEGVWTYNVFYRADLRGYHCQNCSLPNESFIANGDDLKIIFWAKTADLGTPIPMIGDVFRIPLPVSKVSTYFEKKPEFTFYPYFFGTSGAPVVMDLDSNNQVLGTRKIVVYLPPGY